MNIISAIIGTPLGWIMWLCYSVVKNYGLAIILFTIITKAILFPLSIKQQKNSVKMASFQPKLQAIQKRYANNKEKLSEEMNKLYQKEGYNPMSGCLPLFIQFPILFGLIDVIYNPLKHMLRFPSEAITKAVEISNSVLGTGGAHVSSQQLGVISAYQADPGAFSVLGTEFGQDLLDRLANFDLTFFGLNFAQTPHWGLNLLVLIPIISGLTSFLLSLQSMHNMKIQQQDQAGGGMMKSMMYIMPLFSVFFAFSVPAGVGFYWIVSNVVSIGQSALLNKMYDPRKIAEARKQAEEEAKQLERQERIEAKRKAVAGKDKASKEAVKGMTEKELNRLKLAQARKRDAEKYGEEYVEVTDDDLK